MITQQKKATIRVSCMLLTLLVICSCLTGCDFSIGNSYVSITNHDETYDVLETSNTITVNSQLSLKTAILNFIMEGTEDATVHVDSFSDNMPAAFSEVVYEVGQQNPIGAYAVESMTYEYTRIVGYYELTIHVIYRHTSEELQSIVYLSDTDSIKSEMMRAMSECAPELVMNIGSYTGVDPQKLADTIFKTQSDFALVRPEISYTEYPKSGTQRILDIQFSYTEDQQTCLSKMEQASQKVQEVMERLNPVEDKYAVAKRAYNIICRNADEVLQDESMYPYADSVYGVLVDKTGTSFGFARTYQKVLTSSGIVCALVNGRRNGYQLTWCRVEIGSDVFYVDPGTAALTNNMVDFRIEPLELIELGYEIGI